MSDYIITVNSTVDTTREWLAERGVPYIPLKYTIDGQTYSDMEGLSSKEFFDKLREGKMSTTSQINPDEAREALEPYLKEGKDILHLSFSSGLSGTCNSMKIAAEELQEEYPERKIIVIDTLCACLGEALLLYYVLKQKENGATIEEAAKWAEENKLHICHDVTVDDLNHLHRGGRVSKTSAVLGTMVQIKPIIIITKIDLNRELIPVIKKKYNAYDLCFVSSKENEGIEEIKPILKNRVTVVTGQSGVGKSSLLNALNIELNIETNEISQALGRGKHTTRHTMISANS